MKMTTVDVRSATKVAKTSWAATQVTSVDAKMVSGALEEVAEVRAMAEGTTAAVAVGMAMGVEVAVTGETMVELAVS